MARTDKTAISNVIVWLVRWIRTQTPLLPFALNPVDETRLPLQTAVEDRNWLLQPRQKFVSIVDCDAAKSGRGRSHRTDPLHSHANSYQTLVLPRQPAHLHPITISMPAPEFDLTSPPL